MIKKIKKKKNWILQGYYFDGKESYTIMADPDNTLNQKLVKGIDESETKTFKENKKK